MLKFSFVTKKYMQLLMTEQPEDSIMWMQNELWNWQPKLCETYWEKANTVPTKFLGSNLQSEILTKGSEKKWMVGGIKDFILLILLFLVKKWVNKNMTLRTQFQILILV